MTDLTKEDVDKMYSKDPFLFMLGERKIGGIPYSHKYWWFQEEMAKDTSKKVVVQKSAQMGLSELYLSQAIWFLKYKGENVLYALPTMQNAVDFSSLKIDPVISQFQSIKDEIANTKGEDKKNAARIKKIGGNHLIIKGLSGERSNIESFSAGLIMLDEFSKISDLQWVSLAKQRMNASRHKLERYFSTPVYPGDNIEVEFKKGTQKHYYIKCEHCGHEQTPNFFTHHNKFNKNEDIKKLVPHYCCEKCSGYLDLMRDDGEGRWIEHNPKGKFNSYFINRVFQPIYLYDEAGELSVSDSSDILWEEYKLAVEDEERMPEFYRQNLGIGYLSANEAINAFELEDCSKIGSPVFSDTFVPDDGKKYAIGCDTGKSLHYVVLDITDSSLVKLVKYGKISGDKVFDQLQALIDSVVPDIMVIDRFPHEHAVLDLCKNNYDLNIKGAYPNEGLSSVWLPGKSTEPNYILYNRTIAFDITFGLIKNKKIVLPMDMDKEFKTHFTNVIRIQKEKRFTYAGRTGGKMPDHYLSALVFAVIAKSAMVERKKVNSSIVILADDWNSL